MIKETVYQLALPGKPPKYSGRTTDIYMRMARARSDARSGKVSTPVMKWMRSVGIDNVVCSEIVTTTPAKARKLERTLINLVTHVDRGGVNANRVR